MSVTNNMKWLDKIDKLGEVTVNRFLSISGQDRRDAKKWLNLKVSQGILSEIEVSNTKKYRIDKIVL